MARKKTGLGRGLDSLIPVNEQNGHQSRPEKTKEIIKEVIKEVPAETRLKVSDIEPNRKQPRQAFDQETLEELADSIRQVGIVQPLIVQKKGDRYEIIAGERRWRAAKIAGIKEVPVIIKDYSPREAMEIALIENIQRRDLNPVEEAQAYERLIEEYDITQDEVAKKVSKSRSAVTNSLRLLKLPEEVRRMLSDEVLTTGHARALLSLNDSQTQIKTAQRIADQKLSVRETEKLVKSLLKPAVKKPESASVNDEAIYSGIQNRLEEITGTKVRLRRTSQNRGKIEIDYYSAEDLERLVEMFGNMRS